MADPAPRVTLDDLKAQLAEMESEKTERRRKKAEAQKRWRRKAKEDK